MTQKPLKVYLGKSNAAKLQTVIAAKTFLKDKLGCEIVEWSSSTSQQTNDRNLLSCDLMYIIPDPLAGVLGKGLYESIRKFKNRATGWVVMERNGSIESVTSVEPISYSRDWSRFASYKVGKQWFSRKEFFTDEFNIQTITDGMSDYTIVTEKKPNMVTIDLETSNPCAEIYMNNTTGEVQFKRSEVNDIFEPVKPMEGASGILYYMDVIYTSWEDDPYAMLLIELL